MSRAVCMDCGQGIGLKKRSGAEPGRPFCPGGGADIVDAVRIIPYTAPSPGNGWTTSATTGRATTPEGRRTVRRTAAPLLLHSGRGCPHHCRACCTFPHRIGARCRLRNITRVPKSLSRIIHSQDRIMACTLLDKHAVRDAPDLSPDAHNRSATHVVYTQPSAA